jgi:hypothetical protein
VPEMPYVTVPPQCGFNRSTLVATGGPPICWHAPGDLRNIMWDPYVEPYPPSVPQRAVDMETLVRAPTTPPVQLHSLYETALPLSM